MRILILGGTGFMGKPLSQALATEGHELAVHSRGERPVNLSGGATHIKGDRWKLDAVADEIDSFAPEVVVDMFAMTAEDDLPVLKFFSERVRRYVLISSCDVYRSMGRILGTEPGDIIEGLIDETGPLREKLYPYRKITEHTGGNHYDKIPLETACLSDFDFEGTVLRLPMVYGPGDRQHRFRDDVKHMADKRPVLFLPKPVARWISTYGYVENVAAAIAAAATHEEAAGEIFNIGEVNDMTSMDWAKAIGVAMDWTGTIVTDKPANLPPKRAALADSGNLSQFIQNDFSKIQRQLGFQPPIDFETSLVRMIDWELSSLEEIPADAYDYKADDEAFARRQDSQA